MSMAEPLRAAAGTPHGFLRRAAKNIGNIPNNLIEILLAFTLSLPAIWFLRRWLVPATTVQSPARRGQQFIRSAVVFALGLGVTLVQVVITITIVGVIVVGTYLLLNPSIREAFDVSNFFASNETSAKIVSSMILVGLAVALVMADRLIMDRLDTQHLEFPLFRALLLRRLSITRNLVRVGNTMILMGLSLLPLSSLLVALPTVNPSEAVLVETVPPVRTMWQSIGRRLKGLVYGVVLFLVLLAFAVEIVTDLRLSGDTFYGMIVKNVLSADLINRLPNALVEHWPHVILIIYLLDLALLVAIGKVPHKYSIRNMVVRWRITLLTMLAFVVVLFMLTFMLAFVNGMTKLTENSAIPGNVIILSDGATDEIFSNLGYGDVTNIDRIVVNLDEFDRPLSKPVTVKTFKRDGRTVYMSSRETYCVVNQVIPNSNNRRRFVQLRIVVDPEVSSKVHNLELLDKGHEWFSDVGVDQAGRIQCVVGQGIAATLGEDLGKKTLEPGDTFDLADLKWVVTGIMKTEGTTFGSEIWCSNVNTVTSALGKKSYTTIVVRVSEDTDAAAKAFAYHIRNRYQVTKLKALSEKEYFADLNKNNQQTLYSIIVVAVVMAIGGVFGVMNTMFAAIAQRTRDIGVLRLLGFKRWQVLVSFLLESMVIAVAGGLIGIALGYLTDGFSVTSIASGGQGGGKSVAAKLIVDLDVMLIGMLFTLVMGRLGGLVPALSAMRLEILESLR
jgi:ABC-type antimicrobial peptide transport system permease subunit